MKSMKTNLGDIRTEVSQSDYATTEFLLLHQNALRKTDIDFPVHLAQIWRGWPGHCTKREEICQRQMKTQKDTWVLFQTPNIAQYYEMGHVIGTPGQYGTVREAVNKETGQKCAVKIISKVVYTNPKIRGILFEDVRHEVYIMEQAKRHPNIVEIYEVFESIEYIYIVMEELCGDELYDYMQENRHKMCEARVCRIFSQMLNAIFYLHSLNVVHCDIKPENFVFTTPQNKNLKLIDFGMSKILTWRSYFSRMNGTPYYVAPEVLQGHYNESSDIWSLGICLYALCYGVPPFFSNKKDRKSATKEVYDLTKKGFSPVTKPGYGPWFPAHIKTSSLFKDLVSRLLRTNVADRITSGETFNHSWMKLMYEESENPPQILNPVMIQSFIGFHEGKQLFHEIINILHHIGFLNPHQEDVVMEELRKMDTNQDGMVSFEEFKACMKKIDPLMEDRSIKVIFKIADEDHDGVLVGEELLSARIYRKIISKIDRLEKLFKIMDTDDDGYIDEHDVQSVLETCTSTTKEGEPVHHSLDYYRNMIHEVDQNQDGKLSFSEFLKVFGVDQERVINNNISSPIMFRRQSLDGYYSDQQDDKAIHFRSAEPNTGSSLSDIDVVEYCKEESNFNLHPNRSMHMHE